MGYVGQMGRGRKRSEALTVIRATVYFVVVFGSVEAEKTEEEAIGDGEKGRCWMITDVSTGDGRYVDVIMVLVKI